MDKIYDICCGIDVHKKLIVACLNHKRKKELREFGATTRELMELAEWLQKNECEIVAMESTGSYWKPLYNIMESYGLHAIVVNPAHMKAVPGRKTDVKDAEWIAELLQHGYFSRVISRVRIRENCVNWYSIGKVSLENVRGN